MSTLDVNRTCMGCMTPIETTGQACPHCGYEEGRERMPRHLPLCTILNGKYLVGKVLEEDDLGITYSAWDLALEVRAVVKEYFPAGCVGRSGDDNRVTGLFSEELSEEVEKGKARFLSHAKSMLLLGDQPGAVSMRDAFVNFGTAYYVTGYIEGVTLRRYLEELGGKLPADRALPMLKPIAGALEAMHKKGLFHRDICLDTILVLSEGGARLLAGRPIEENAEGGARADVSALCTVLYKVLTGSEPAAQTEAGGPVLPSKLGAALPESVDEALLRGLNGGIFDMPTLLRALYGAREESAAPDEPPRPGSPAAVAAEESGQVPEALPAARRGKKKLVLPAVIGAAVLCVFLLACLIPSLLKPGSSSHAMGAGNNVNGGMFTLDGEWLYFTDTRSDPYSLVKQRLDGSGLERMSGMAAMFINAIDGVVYYSDGADSCRMKKIAPGGEAEVVYDADSYYSQYYDGWIYFLDSGAVPCRIKPDGSAFTKLADTSSRNLILSNGRLYYISGGDKGSVASMKPDGSDIKPVGEIQASGFMIDGERVYYLDYDYKLRSANLDGTDDRAVVEKAIAMYETGLGVNVGGDWIYYIDSEDESIYRVGKEGGTPFRLNHERSRSISMIGDRLYYYKEMGVNSTGGSNFFPYSMKLDGSDNRSLLDD